jgi:hypothetical protein
LLALEFILENGTMGGVSMEFVKYKRLKRKYPLLLIIAMYVAIIFALLMSVAKAKAEAEAEAKKVIYFI